MCHWNFIKLLFSPAQRMDKVRHRHGIHCAILFKLAAHAGGVSRWMKDELGITDAA
jgi:hypothetical protein